MSVVRVPHITSLFESISPSFLGGGGKTNFMASRDRTTDLAEGGGFWGMGGEKFCAHPGSNHRPRGSSFSQGGGIFGLGKKKYAATWDRTTDHYYRPLKNWPNHPYYRSQKIEKSLKKKIVRNFLHKIIFFFFEFFSENVFKTLLRGRETTRKKYRIVCEKFFNFALFFFPRFLDFLRSVVGVIWSIF